MLETSTINKIQNPQQVHTQKKSQMATVNNLKVKKIYLIQKEIKKCTYQIKKKLGLISNKSISMIKI